MSAVRIAALVLATGLVAACAGVTTPSGTGSSVATSSPAATVPATPSPLPPSAPPSDPVPPSAALLGSPPLAVLAVEGGDPVEGQLGTYTWAGGGSDAPWLPGSPIAAAAGEPMVVTFEPVVAIASWRARIVPAAATGPAGARLVGEGSGQPRFEAPAPGAWTLEVQVTFAAGMGAANYAWALSVT